MSLIRATPVSRKPLPKHSQSKEKFARGRLPTDETAMMWINKQSLPERAGFAVRLILYNESAGHSKIKDAAFVDN